MRDKMQKRPASSWPVDGTDLPMILLKGAASAVPLEDASILPEKRFCYFDQPHTTGIDINQPSLGV